MKTIRKGLLLGLMVILLSSCTVLDQLLGGLANSGKPTNAEMEYVIKSMLKWGVDEALTIATDREGFYNNLKTRVKFPQEIEDVEKKLRALGLGDMVDGVIYELNKVAAEGAIEAGNYFKTSIDEMKIDNPYEILSKAGTPATAVFEAAFRPKLEAQIKPLAESVINTSEAATTMDKLLRSYNAIPFIKKADTDLPSYVTNQILDLFFKEIASKETEIGSNYMNSNDITIIKVMSYFESNRKVDL